MKPKFKKWRIILRYIFLGLYIFCIGLIIYESTVVGSESASKSDEVATPFINKENDEYDNSHVVEITDFDVSLSSDSSRFYVGDVITYAVSFLPEDTSYKGYDIEYDNTYIKVNSIDNKIEFLKDISSTTITFKSTRNESLSKSFTLTILPIDVSEISITNKPTSFFNEGDTYQLTYKILPSNATYKDVSFSSSDESVCKVSDSGLITCLKPGNASISIYCGDKSDSFDITINAKEVIVKEIESISIEDNSKTAYINDNVSFTLKVNPVESNYDVSKISFSNTYDLSISISDKTIKVNCSKIGEFKDITVSYLKDDGSILSTSFSLIVRDKKYLTKDDINTSKLVSSVSSSITNYTYIKADNTTSSKQSIASFKVSIPFNISSFKGYYLNNYKFEYDTSKLKLVSSSYSSATFKSTSSSYLSGSIYYYVDKGKDDKIEFTYSYSIVSEVVSMKIASVSIPKLGDSITLFNHYKYENILSDYKILLENNTTYNESGVDINILDNETLVKENDYLLIKDNSLITKKVSKDITLRVSSLVDTSIYKDIKISITDIPNKAYLVDENSNPLESNYLELDLDEIKYIDVKYEYNQSFNDNTSLSISQIYENPSNEASNLIDISYSYSVTRLTTNSAVVYQDINKIFKGIDQGEDEFEYTFDDSSLNIILKIKVNYIKVSLFEISFENVSSLKYNSPSKDFSKVGLKSRFQINCKINEDATNKKVHYTSSNQDVISISSSGLCQANKVGESIISVTLDDDSSKVITKEIQVLNTVSPFSIDGTNLEKDKFKLIQDGEIKVYEATLYYGYSYSFKISPVIDTSYTKLKFSYVDIEGNKTLSNIIRVDQSCHVNLLNIGETTLKITYGDNDLTLNKYSCYIKFNVIRNNKAVIKNIAYYVRKYFGHFGLFFVLGFLSCVVMVNLTYNIYERVGLASISTLIGIFVGLISELIQLYVPGRAGKLKDVAIDSFGYLASMGIYLIVVIILEIISRIKARKKKTRLDILNV